MSSSGKLRCELGRIALPGHPRAGRVRLRDDKRGIRVSVVPADGGEIAGIRYRIGGRWHELLYRGLDYQTVPPDGWPGRAPMLWPAVGRSFLPEQLARSRQTRRPPRACRYQWGGRVYSIPNHGFARDLCWKLDSCGAGPDSAWVKCTVGTSPETRKKYPFEFRLSVTHRLVKGRIASRYEVTAGPNQEAMPFCIGNHISFRMPFTRKGRYEDCTVRTPGRQLYELDDAGLLSGKTRKMDVSKPVTLGEGMYDDKFLKGYHRRNAWAELVDPNALTVRITQSEKRVRGRFTAEEKDIAFVFWGEPEHNQICPEPWIGFPNALNSGKGLLRLAPHGRFVWEMRIAFKPS